MKRNATTSSVLLALASLGAVAFVPTGSAHDCDTLVPPLGCGWCDATDHDGSHNFTVGNLVSIPYCSSTPNLPTPDDNPACDVLENTEIGRCPGN